MLSFLILCTGEKGAEQNPFDSRELLTFIWHQINLQLGAGVTPKQIIDLNLATRYLSETSRGACLFLANGKCYLYPIKVTFFGPAFLLHGERQRRRTCILLGSSEDQEVRIGQWLPLEQGA